MRFEAWREIRTCGSSAADEPCPHTCACLVFEPQLVGAGNEPRLPRDVHPRFTGSSRIGLAAATSSRRQSGSAECFPSFRGIPDGVTDPVPIK